MKMLVAYFSCSHVTEQLAQTIAQSVDGDLFEIKPLHPYTSADLNWNDENSRSSLEMKDQSSRPEIAFKVENMDKYDIVFVGFPIWWYRAPTIINTFLESYDLKGKTIVPFATSGGSGAGDTNLYLEPSVSLGARLFPTTILNGQISQMKIMNWIQGLKL